VTSHWLDTPRGDHIIVTRMQLDVEETIKGSVDTAIFMEVPGGTADGVTLRVSGQPVLTEGDRAVFMLDAPQAGTHKPHGRGEGVLKLDSDNNVRGRSLKLDDVRRAARAGRK
jgi:hypothetical protein